MQLINFLFMLFIAILLLALSMGILLLVLKTVEEVLEVFKNIRKKWKNL